MHNSKIQVYKLDPYSLPLYGLRLIESSAGTGKTHTIALLYLRLLLGIGQKNAFSRVLNIEEILVVTFTKSSTNELRSRICYNIHQMRLACIRDGIGFHKNSIFRILLFFILDKKLAAQWLLMAENQINKLAIYTIHSFCHHILLHNAFESGMLFKQSIIKDEYILQKKACADFWRCNCYLMDYSLVKVITKEWSGPEELLSEVKPFLQGDLPIFINQSIKGKSIIQRHKIIINIIKKIKKLWIANSSSFFNLINNSSINKRIYNNKNLSYWLTIINNWAKLETIDYEIPKELNRFSQSELINNTLIGDYPKHNIFFVINNLLQKSLTLRDIFISKAIINIRKIIKNEKKRLREIGFDDLLNYLDQALYSKNGNYLTKVIRKLYPIVMIDEFQDTDPQQYRIFKRIYYKYNNCGLLLIGDPKQAIYSFRGADIFTYLKAKNDIKSYYTIDTNWRSSVSMIKAINKLFSLSKKPFLFKQIPFNTINSSSINNNLGFVYKTKQMAALNFHYLDKELVSILDYQKALAYQCASQIYDWLKDSKNGTTWLYSNNIKQQITYSDIMILVRNSNEAVIIQKELSKFNIPSVFLSNRESVFNINEAQDILWLLKSILSPENKKIMRCALATSIIGLSAQDIEKLNNNENQWEIRIKEFTNYLLIWNRYGILSTLRSIIINNRITENLLVNNIDGKKRLMDLMYIGELLQEVELKFNNKHTLVRWLAHQINYPDSLLDNKQIRLENDSNLINISTIHKSKGLEYPIVWLPFACYFYQKKMIIFHSRKNFKTYLDLTYKESNIKLANEECLSEDLRLLYVALTRSIYHCSVGVAPLIKSNTNKKNRNTDLHQTALGYLLQNKKIGDSILLRNSLESLVSKNISIIIINNNNLYPLYRKKNKQVKLLAKTFVGKIKNNWKVTSYSELLNNNIYLLNNKFIYNNVNIKINIQDLIPKINTNIKNENFLVKCKITNKNINTFPKGIITGTFLHFILKLLPFNKDPSEIWLAKKLEQAGFSKDWAPILKTWLINIFTTNLLKNNLSLSNIKSKYQLHEMQFYLSIKNLLSPSILDNLTHQYDSLSRSCASLSFEPVTGILKGYIDLVFYWKNKFYLIDYKSNWLGENYSSYNRKALQQSIIDNRYDLQYQLYTLAFHRYLQNCFSYYNYKKHFGGIIYLFLRGINYNNINYGIYHTIPDYGLINGIDELFSITNMDKKDDYAT
ncbi:MAG: exodeoxyribonuclease V subunit beta [Arsenophonus endosymbiont of Ceratovacuna japonica]